jgi:lysozyme
MQISANGLELIKRFEGFRSRVYLDVAAHPTIGYGHKLLPHEAFPAGVTEPGATVLLEHDARVAEQEVASLVKARLSQGQFDALVDFVYNLGSGRLAGSTLLRLIDAGQYAAAGAQLLRWDKADGRELADLRARRQAELALWKA